MERSRTGGRVRDPSGVASKGHISVSRVLGADSVAIKRLRTGGGVVVPGGIAKERSKTNTCVVKTAGEVLERILTLRSVVTRIPSVRRRARENPESFRGRRKRKAAERDEKTTPKAFGAD